MHVRLIKISRFYGHMKELKKKLKLKIFGRVQGVYFRKTTQRVARDLGLTGYVENMPDGTVELEVFGRRLALEELLQFCKKGPELAQIEKVEVQWNKVKSSDVEDNTDFIIKRTGSVIQDQFNSFKNLGKNLGKKVFKFKSSRVKNGESKKD